MINTNNYSQNRGSEVINTMRDYSYSDTFYNAIVQEELHWFYPSFPQTINNTCGKVSINSGKG